MIEAQPLLAYFDANRQAMLDRIRELVVDETPTHDKARLDAFAQRMAERLTQLGGRVEIIPVQERGNHVRARFAAGANAAAGEQTKPALILCHMDTVWPVGSLATHPFRIEEGKAYGPGIFDMQSSLVLVEFALAAMRNRG